LQPIDLNDVAVIYPAQKIPSLKEWIVRGVTGRHERGGFAALRGVNLTIERGEAFGIIGPNGAGKSTLLRVIAGIIPPSAGEVVTRGSVAPLIELGTGFDGELTGRENIFFNGALLGRSRPYMESRMEEIVSFAALGAFIDSPLRTYSTGMVARLAFAIAITVDADIVLLDEILSVGDATFREKCDERIQRFHAGGSTIVLVSHDLDSVMRLCSRAAWVEGGRIRQVGMVEEVVRAYVESLHLHAAPAAPELAAHEP
jgi:ABC-type polysaccharide/polyol phosphate transport system ATPase subunit